MPSGWVSIVTWLVNFFVFVSSSDSKVVVIGPHRKVQWLMYKFLFSGLIATEQHLVIFTNVVSPSTCGLEAFNDR